MADGISSVGMLGAKSVFDMLAKTTSGGKQDRITMIELAIRRDGLQRTGSVIRWLPHTRMPVDCKTKADIAMGNFALTPRLQKGRLSLRLGAEEGGSKDRSKAAPRRQFQEVSPEASYSEAQGS